MRFITGTVSHRKDSDMEFQVHYLETEAYGAVLKAFIAQSDVLSWEKEELITELRKELRVSDVEHRQILARIHSDETVKSIKEARDGTQGQQVNTMNPPVSDPMIGHASRKRIKHAYTPAASSPRFPARCQPSPLSPPSSAMHARNDQWNSNTAVFSHQMNAGQQPLMPFSENRQPPASSGKLRGSTVVQMSRRASVHSGSGNMESGSEIIEIRKTDKLIHEVENICRHNPDPAQVERAKSILREHERALLDAIGRLANASGGDDSPRRVQNQHQYSNDGRQRNAIRGYQNGGDYEQFDRSKSFYGDSYVMDSTGVPCVDIPCVDTQDGGF